MTRSIRLAGLLFVLAACTACGGTTRPTPPLPLVQGRWQGTIASPADGVGIIALALTQQGADLTGSVILSQPGLPDAPGTFTGTFDASAGPAVLRYSTFYDYGDGCTGTYGGSLTLSGTTLSGTYVGQNCAHTFTGTIRVEKAQ